MKKTNRRIGYWDAEKKLTHARKILVEKKLSQLGQKIEYFEIAQIDNLHASVDLFITTAELVPPENFSGWLTSLKERLEAHHQIWVPALVFANRDFNELQGIFSVAYDSNWYFDIVHMDHIDSLPLRAANLLKIHDHLHELRRYDTKLKQLEQEVAHLHHQLTQ